MDGTLHPAEAWMGSTVNLTTRPGASATSPPKGKGSALQPYAVKIMQNLRGWSVVGGGTPLAGVGVACMAGTGKTHGWVAWAVHGPMAWPWVGMGFALARTHAQFNVCGRVMRAVHATHAK